MKTEISTSKELTFEKIYSKYRNEILNFINYKMNYKNKEVAKEICNDTFLKGVPTFDPSNGTKITTWLKGIAFRCILDSYRKDTISKTVEVADDFGNSMLTKIRSNNKSYISDYVYEDGNEWLEFDSQSDASANVENAELLTSVNESLLNLKPKYQQIANLRFVEEYSYNEIAEMLSIPLGNVKVLVNRCKKMLQNQLKTVGASYSLR